MLQGQEVTLSSRFGLVRRLVLEDLGEVVVVCRREELEAAQREGREPACVGFKRTDIVQDGEAEA